MTAANKNSHLTLEERKIIETGIANGSTKKAIADTIGKDIIGKEFKEHRVMSHKCSIPLECNAYRKYTHGRQCASDFPDYIPFICKRKDQSPGACNSCSDYNSCHFNRFRYNAFNAQNDYRESLVNSRLGINATVNEIKALGEKIKSFEDFFLAALLKYVLFRIMKLPFPASTNPVFGFTWKHSLPVD